MGAETCGLSLRGKRKLNVMDMKYLKMICGGTIRDKIRNEKLGED